MNQENHPENKELKTVYMAPPEWYHPMQEDEIDLVSLVGVLWRRKKLIAGIALGMTVLAAVVAFFVMTSRYKVSALVSPGIIGFNEDGTPIPASSLTDLQQWLNSGGYIDDMLERLPSDAMAQRLIPKPEKIETSAPKNGQVLSVNLFTPEPKKGKEALQRIFDIMAENQQPYEHARKNLEKRIADIDQQLDNWDIQQTRHVVVIKKAEQEVGLMKNDLELLETSHQSAIEKAEKEIELMERDMVRLDKDIQARKKSVDRLDEQIQEINANTLKIRTQRDDIAGTAKENDIALLMYSNIIQQNIDYATRLEERQDQSKSGILEQLQQYSVKKVEINNKRLDLTDLKEKQVQKLLRSKKELESMELELDDLKENKARELEETRKKLARQSELLKSRFALLSPLRIVQKPMSSDEPVKPNKKKIIVLAAIMGIFLGVVVAFLVEFYVINKDRLNKKLS
jgi:capsular polysaccharide biosynthesis protein